jgi:hypothetical protein
MKLAEEKAAFQREQENEMAVLKANYESLLKEKDDAFVHYSLRSFESTLSTA